MIFYAFYIIPYVFYKLWTAYFHYVYRHSGLVYSILGYKINVLFYAEEIIVFLWFLYNYVFYKLWTACFHYIYRHSGLV